MKQKYTPKFKRQKDRFNFHLTERDFEILKAINRYRYMRCKQVSSLLAPQNKTVRTIQKRLMLLYHSGFLGRVIPFIQLGKGMGEVAYFLDKKGAKLLEENGETPKVHKKASQVKYQFLNHALDLSEFRLHIERTFEEDEVVKLKRFVADFEIKEHTKDAIGRNRYKLYDKIQNPINRKFYEVYPDALIIFEIEKIGIQKLVFLEIDRGTEKLSVIQDKVFGYDLYFRKNIYKKFGKFNGFTVMFQCNSEKREKNIQKAISHIDGHERILTTHQALVNDESVLYEEIWTNHKDEKISILRK